MLVSTLFNSFLILVSLFFLLFGADKFLESGERISKSLGIDDRLLGLILVSISTSLPELAVAILAALDNKSEIVLGDIIGSNFANLGLGLGIGLIISPLVIKKETLFNEVPIHGAITLATLLLILNDSVLDKYEALTILIFFALMLLNIYKDGIKSKEKQKLHWKDLAYFVGSLALVIISAKILINSTIVLAKNLNLMPYLVSSLVIAIGTSLPEITVSIISSLKRKINIALGDVLGSNIFNMGVILPIATIINPIHANIIVINHLFLLLLLTTYLTLSAYVKRKLTKIDGLILLIGYILFLTLFISKA
ncbi:NEQ486 [Nanoarchaeum equitans Kin4-M]|uniref:NEQ486 n=1 Tax=Nanoarchaeum equitans (strain Kin4-M) TaxID=228908 RepID=Q74MB9_NANEQ|nr:NEQ486 [Nanoarchaeum equitans Kin4-M]